MCLFTTHLKWAVTHVIRPGPLLEFFKDLWGPLKDPGNAYGLPSEQECPCEGARQCLLGMYTSGPALHVGI